MVYKPNINIKKVFEKFNRPTTYNKPINSSSKPYPKEKYL